MNKAKHNNGKPLYFSLNPEEQENEIFKAIANEPKYEVSNLGRVRSLKKSGNKILSSIERLDFVVKLSNQRHVKIKNLMYETFISPLKSNDNVVLIDGNKYNLTIKNLKLYSEEELKIKEAEENMPYEWSKDPRPQTGERFLVFCDYDFAYTVSNYGRVKRQKDIGLRCKKGTVLRPQRGNKVAKFTVRLAKGKYIPIQEVMYRAHIGAIPEGKQVVCKDGDRKNLNLKNLVLKSKNFKLRHKKRKDQEKKLKPVSYGTQPLTKTIDLSTGDKKKKLKEASELKRRGYYLASKDNYLYHYKLKPKEGDTVKVKNSQYIDKKEYKVTKKDGIKYELEGYGEGIYFLANELEIIKKS